MEIEGLLDRYAGQIGLSADHQDALRRVLTERPAFVAWEQFFTDGGRVRPFKPIAPEDLEKTPPSELALVGDGRYVPDRLLIVSRPDEPAMDAFLFHEIQHYVLDKWDSAVFESGERLSGDHEVIEILEERRRIVDAIRSGQIPRDAGRPRVLRDFDGAITKALEDGDWEEAAERAEADSYYQGWVTATVRRVLAKNENNERIRMVSMQLSDGATLLFDERSDREEPDAIKATDMRIPPHYRHGPVTYVSLGDLRRLDVSRLFSEGHVPEEDRPAVEEFVLVHQQDQGLGREHVYTDLQVQDLAHLSGYNAAIVQQALRLAVSLGAGEDIGGEEVMKRDRYQTAFAEFLRRFADRMAQGAGADPRSIARDAEAEATPG